jgi:hypothetical protein
VDKAHGQGLGGPPSSYQFQLLKRRNSGHRIRHYGLFAGAVRADNIERARQLLAAAENAPQPSREADSRAEDVSPARRCPCCGGRMIIVETFEGPRPWRSSSPSRIRIDSS